MWRIKAAISAFLTLCIYLLGGLDLSLKALLVLIVMDFITGLLKAIEQKTLNSDTGLKGILKKLLLLCLVAVAVAIDTITINNGVIRTLVIYYIAANEGLSILENIAALGVAVPEFLKERLEQLKEGETNDYEKGN